MSLELVPNQASMPPTVASDKIPPDAIFAIRMFVTVPCGANGPILPPPHRSDKQNSGKPGTIVDITDNESGMLAMFDRHALARLTHSEIASPHLTKTPTRLSSLCLPARVDNHLLQPFARLHPPNRSLQVHARTNVIRDNRHSLADSGTFAALCHVDLAVLF